MKRFFRVLLSVVLVMSLLLGTIPAFAAESPTTMKLGKVYAKKVTYNGKVQTPKMYVHDTEGNTIPAENYTIKISGTPKNAGSYEVTVTCKAPYVGKKMVHFRIEKASNPFKIVAGRTSFKLNKTKNQTTSIKVSGVKEKAKLTSWSTTNSKVYVKGGKIIVKKGFSGSATISISTKETKNYKATKKKIKITVKK